MDLIKVIWKKCSRILPDRLYICLEFKKHIGYFPNLKSPKTFNEKLQWLKLHDRKPIYTTMVDKCEAKKYVADIIGDEYIIPTLGVWDHFDEIDFSTLPNQFVLKCTHDSAGIVIVKDKNRFDRVAARKKIENCLKRNFFYSGREWPYKNVKPRIIAEEYMEDGVTRELRDYKFFCVNGVVRCFKVDFDWFIEHRANYFDKDGALIDIGEIECPPNPERIIELPGNISLMENLAEMISNGVPFLRTDFYSVDEKVYFGELTFAHWGGMTPFKPEKWDTIIGEWIKLQNK